MPDVLIASERRAVRVSGSAAPSTANLCLITMRIRTVDGRPRVRQHDLWLSDAASGAGHTAVTATGNVQAGASGLVVDTHVAKKALRIQTTVDGLFILSITDTAKTPFVVCVEVEGVGIPLVTLTTANYG
jgi:hypothetical protein